MIKNIKIKGGGAMTLKCPFCGKFAKTKTVKELGWCDKCQEPLNKADKINQRVEKILRAK